MCKQYFANTSLSPTMTHCSRYYVLPSSLYNKLRRHPLISIYDWRINFQLWLEDGLLWRTPLPVFKKISSKRSFTGTKKRSDHKIPMLSLITLGWNTSSSLLSPALRSRCSSSSDTIYFPIFVTHTRTSASGWCTTLKRITRLYQTKHKHSKTSDSIGNIRDIQTEIQTMVSNHIVTLVLLLSVPFID